MNLLYLRFLEHVRCFLGFFSFQIFVLSSHTIDVLMHKYFQYARLAAELIQLVYNVIKG